MLRAGAAGAETVTGAQGRGRQQQMADSGYADFGFTEERRKVKSRIECPFDADENASPRASLREYLLTKLAQPCSLWVRTWVHLHYQKLSDGQRGLETASEKAHLH